MQDIVTQVIQGKNLVKVVINDREVLELSPRIYRERPLMPNDPVDLAALREWLLKMQYPEALHRAVGFLATRARSRQEVRQKLQSLGYMEQTADLVLCKLEKEGLVDDEAFARDWAAARVRRHLGKGRILLELRQKGVPRQLAEKACAEMDPEELDGESVKLAASLLKRHAGEPDPAKALRKVLAAMSRRGFGYEEASAAVASALERLRTDG